jgi:hypothetical protein
MIATYLGWNMLLLWKHFNIVTKDTRVVFNGTSVIVYIARARTHIHTHTHKHNGMATVNFNIDVVKGFLIRENLSESRVRNPSLKK